MNKEVRKHAQREGRFWLVGLLLATLWFGALIVVDTPEETSEQTE